MTINVTKKTVQELLQWILLIAIFGMLLWSQPWQQSSASARKITVVGEASTDTEPDEYLFSPYFQQSGTNKDALKESLTKKANAAVTKLKELGVEEKDIKVDASSYDYWYATDEKDTPMTVSLQITVRDKDLAQEIQDYLLTLDIEGQLTPSATFSADKRKALEAQLTEEASKDARAKAEAQAKSLGAKLGKVLEVSQSGDSVMPMYASGMAVAEDTVSSGATRSSLEILPGQNEYTQVVSVTYELK